MVKDNDYRAGFEQGYRSVKGSMAMLPLLPLQPLTPLGKTPFQVGLEMGVKAAGGYRR